MHFMQLGKSICVNMDHVAVIGVEDEKIVIHLANGASSSETCKNKKAAVSEYNKIIKALEKFTEPDGMRIETAE